MEQTTYMGADVAPLLEIDTLSGLARAVVDAAGQLDSREYLPSSGMWHTPEKFQAEEGSPATVTKCQICDAGAVLAGLCKLDPETNFVFPLASTDSALHARLIAIDRIRCGLYHGAYRALKGEYLNAKTAEKLHDIDHPDSITYGDWESFDLHVADLQARVIPELEALGL